MEYLYRVGVVFFCLCVDICGGEIGSDDIWLMSFVLRVIWARIFNREYVINRVDPIITLIDGKQK